MGDPERISMEAIDGGVSDFLETLWVIINRL
jgi:hypothetical protein